MIIIMFGPPGAGKGTQCKYIADRYGFFQLSTGDMIRKEIADGSALGLQVKAIVEAGGFPSSDIVNDMVKSTVTRLKDSEGILFDGYPRTLDQGIYLEGLLKDLGLGVDVAIMLDVDEGELISRIEGRFQCASCGEIYSMAKGMPKAEGICDKCGSTEFKRRADDSAEVMKNRLTTYRSETQEIIDYFDKQGLLIRLDGGRTIESVQADIATIIEKKQTKTHKRSVNMVDL